MVHRDLKPENILLESTDVQKLNLKITDFGFACFFDPSKGLKDVLGSPLYMAPEIVREKTYDNKVDVWSIGVITYILICGKPPWKGKTKPEIFGSILHDELEFTGDIWK
jgi:calcium-dependent protein kinase